MLNLTLLFCLLAQPTDLDLHRARANASIAVALSIHTAKAPIAKAPMAQEAPIVYVILAPFECGPCNKLKDLIAHTDLTKLPFVIKQYVDGDQPPNIPKPDGYPFIVWQTKSKKWAKPRSLPSSIEEFIRIWKHSNADLRTFARSYVGPHTGVAGNDYCRHLLDHGLKPNAIVGLSQWECSKIHDAIHNGDYIPK